MTSIERAVQDNIRILLSMLPAVRDGNADAIHDSRVATRRLRAAVPLAWASEPEERWAEPMDALRTLGQSFGRARDLDVALERLTDIADRLPLSGVAVAFLKRELSDRQGRAHRRLIKTIEELPLDSIRDLRIGRSLLTIGPNRPRRVLAQHLGERATALDDAVERASGVYFPKRAHQVRVNVKKLRYLIELLPDRSQPAGAIKRLRRAQDTLGELHDRQSLMDLIEEVKSGSSEGAQYDPVLALLAHDRHDAFTEYLDQRDRLQRVVTDVKRSFDGHVSRSQILTRGLLMASMVMAPSAAGLIARRRRHADDVRREPPAGSGFGRAAAIADERLAVDARTSALVATRK